jgi:hypothetical protein
MKGIYLTAEGKKEIEAKIAELEEELHCEEIFCRRNKLPVDKWEEGKNQGKIYILEEILSSATILPVEESWYKVIENVENDSQSLILQTPFIMKSLYEQGVIIKPKLEELKSKK